MKRSLIIALITALLNLSSAEGSWLSNAVKNTNKTVTKAVNDTNAEVNRAAARVTGAGGSAVAAQEIQKIGEELSATKAKEVTLQDEKDVAHVGIIGLASAMLGGVIAMASTGMFGRHDRRDKYLAALEREWKLDREGFDFSLVPSYKRLLVRPSQSIEPESP